MLKRFHVDGYQVIPSDGEKGVRWSADLDPAGVDVELDCRAREGAVLLVVNEDGETIFIDEGSVLSFKARLIGAAQLVVESDGDIALRSRAQISVFGEKVDPVPASVSVKHAPLDPIDYQVRLAVERALRARGLSDEIVGIVNEELEDVGELDGDFDLDEDGDPFGAGHYEEMGEVQEEPPPAPSEPPPEPPATPPVPPKPKRQPAAGAPPQPVSDPEEGDQSGEA